jgi:TetR/AcrR family transcriptional regulator, transcriptional repressor for nem operon
MAARKSKTNKAAEGRARLLDAAVGAIRAQGYSATTVDDICARAGLTKGGFFHYFRSKDDCAVAAAAHFAAHADALFDAAPYRRLTDPRQRVLGYVDLRKSMAQGALPQFTCLLGTMAQEAYETHPEIRAACDRYIGEHAAFVAKDIAEAKALHAPDADWTPEGVAFFTQSVIQGAFILAKAQGNAKIAADCLDHLRRYLEGLFAESKSARRAPPALKFL